MVSQSLSCASKTSWLNPLRFSSRLALSIIPSILLITGCTQVQVELPTALIYPKQLKDLALDWQINAMPQPGAYRVAGKTNLPDRTQLTIAALRYLYPVAAAAHKFNDRPTYTILDYQSVAVERGSWQTQLNLWQVGPDRTFKENWQIDQQGLAIQFNPQQDVVFLVTLTPIDQFMALQQKLVAQGEKFPNGTVYSTSEGENIAQSRKTLTIPLPTGSTLVAPPSLQAENFGWGRRYLIPHEPPNPTQLERPSERQTDSPVRAEEFLR